MCLPDFGTPHKKNIYRHFSAVPNVGKDRVAAEVEDRDKVDHEISNVVFTTLQVRFVIAPAILKSF